MSEIEREERKPKLFALQLFRLWCVIQKVVKSGVLARQRTKETYNVMSHKRLTFPSPTFEGKS